MGAIDNQGTIATGRYGVYLMSGATLTGGIANSGTIETPWDGIEIKAASSVVGDIVNRASGTIIHDGQGIYLYSDSQVTGSIVNAGTIDGTRPGYVGNSGIVVQSSTVGHDVSNAGTIFAKYEGIAPWSGSTVSGNVSNAGRIAVTAEEGMQLSSSTVAGAVVNAAGGQIQSGNDGIVMHRGMAIDGGLVNAGTIDAAARSICVDSASSIGGGIVNESTGQVSGRLLVQGTDGTAGTDNGIDLLNRGAIVLETTASEVSGDFTQEATGSLSFTLLDFTSYSAAPLLVGQDASFAGDLILGFAPTFGILDALRFTLIDVAGIGVGTFGNYGDNALVATFGGYDLRLDYTADGDVQIYSELSSVPVPAPLALIGLGALPLLARRRQRA